MAFWLAIAGIASARSLAGPPATVISPGGVATVSFGSARVNNPGSADCTSTPGTTVKVVPDGFLDVKTPLNGLTVVAGSTFKVAVKPSAPPGVVIGISWATSGGNCYSASGITYVRVGAKNPSGRCSKTSKTPVPKTLLQALNVLDNPKAGCNARAAALGILDSASGRTEDETAKVTIDVTLSVYPFGRLLAPLAGLPWVRNLNELFERQIAGLLQKYGPEIKAGSEAAIAAFLREARQAAWSTVLRSPAARLIPDPTRTALAREYARGVLFPEAKALLKPANSPGAFNVADTQTLRKLFDDLTKGSGAKPSKVITKVDGTRITEYQFPGGGTVSYRTNSTTGGPTIEIKGVQGLGTKVSKIHVQPSSTK